MARPKMMNVPGMPTSNETGASTQPNARMKRPTSSNAVSRCAERGEPACPQVCMLPDGTADPYLLGQACEDLVVCELQAMATDAYGATWDGITACALAHATVCGDARGGAAGKFVAKKLNRRRKSKVNLVAHDR